MEEQREFRSNRCYDEAPKRLKGKARQKAMNKLSKKPSLFISNQFNRYC